MEVRDQKEQRNDMVGNNDMRSEQHTEMSAAQSCIIARGTLSLLKIFIRYKNHFILKSLLRRCNHRTKLVRALQMVCTCGFVPISCAT